MFVYKIQADRKPYTTHRKKHTQQETLYHTLQYTCPTRNLTAHIATDMSNRRPTSHIATNMPNRISVHIAGVFAKSDDFPPANSKHKVALIERSTFVLQIAGQDI